MISKQIRHIFFAFILMMCAMLVPSLALGQESSSSIDAGGYHNLAVNSDGTVWAWGYNNGGQLGDGTTTNRNTPVQVQGLTGMIAVSEGFYHSLAVKSDGTVWAWGYNNGGQLGDGTTTNRAIPYLTVNDIVLVSDTTAPATADNAPAGWSNKDVTVTLTASDSGSGVAGTYYMVDSATSSKVLPLPSRQMARIRSHIGALTRQATLKLRIRLSFSWIRQLRPSRLLQRPVPMQVVGTPVM